MTAEGRLTPECRDSPLPSFLPSFYHTPPCLCSSFLAPSGIHSWLLTSAGDRQRPPCPPGLFFFYLLFYFFTSPLIGMSMATQQRASVCAAPLPTKRAFSEPKSRAAHLILNKMVSHLLKRQITETLSLLRRQSGQQTQRRDCFGGRITFSDRTYGRSVSLNASSFQLCTLHPHEAPAGGSCLSSDVSHSLSHTWQLTVLLLFIWRLLAKSVINTPQ